MRDRSGAVTVLLESGRVTAVQVTRTLPREELEGCLLDVLTRLQRELVAEALGGAIGAGRDQVRRGQEQLARLESAHRSSMARAWELLDERRAVARRAEQEDAR